MWIKSLILNNIRSFGKAEIEFSKNINIIVGANNSGKSSILLPILGLQEGLPGLSIEDKRVNADLAEAELYLEERNNNHYGNIENIMFFIEANRNFQLVNSENRQKMQNNQNKQNKQNIHYNQIIPISKISGKEPDNFIYPFLSERKAIELKTDIRSESVSRIAKNFENLNAKIDYLGNASRDEHDYYKSACNKILGFEVYTSNTSEGKAAVYTINNQNSIPHSIPLLSMGAGVMNILGLLVNLAMSENKLFIIEEPENDIHPQALKSLMDIIREKSENNQFIITTHSNIVLKTLGTHKDSKIFSVAVDYSTKDKIPTSIIKEVSNSPDERRKILSDLGYFLNDMELWDGWLILEESSAEKIIREYLIPWFTPTLNGRLRTFSARSSSEVKRKFNDFNDLIVFIHLSPVYKDKAWVLIDDGDVEREIIKELKEKYSKSNWNEDRFRLLSEHDFEEYYPEHFKDDMDCIHQETDKQKKRDMKQKLLDKVEKWIQEDVEAAKQSFQSSAREVIDILKEIESSLA